jgi:hypothetical protein
MLDGVNERIAWGLVRDLVPCLSTALPRSWAATDSALVGDDLLQTESVVLGGQR